MSPKKEVPEFVKPSSLYCIGRQFGWFQEDRAKGVGGPIECWICFPFLRCFHPPPKLATNFRQRPAITASRFGSRFSPTSLRVSPGLKEKLYRLFKFWFKCLLLICLWTRGAPVDIGTPATPWTLLGWHSHFSLFLWRVIAIVGENDYCFHHRLLCLCYERGVVFSVSRRLGSSCAFLPQSAFYGNLVFSHYNSRADDREELVLIKSRFWLRES